MQESEHHHWLVTTIDCIVEISLSLVMQLMLSIKGALRHTN